MWKTARLTARPDILGFLETDRLYAAYAIGDLEPGLFERCEWAGAYGTREADRLQAAVLRFRGLEPPALFLMGDPGGVRAILADPSTLSAAGEVCVTCRREHLPVARSFLALDAPAAMWRMVLTQARFRPAEGSCIRLGPQDIGDLTQLYSLGGGEAFHPRQLAEGVFYGVKSGDRLVAAAGTHLVSRAYGVAAVGNVFTHPARRGRGYGAATTSAVTAELVAAGIRDVVLNVSQANTPAIRAYERLGFDCHCPFLEGIAGNLPARAEIV